MRTLNLADYINTTIVNQKMKNDICPLVAKQISRARYEINNKNSCYLKIVLGDEIIAIYFNNLIQIDDFKRIFYNVSLDEPSLSFFKDYLSKYIDEIKWNQRKPIDIILLLLEYKNQHYKKGTEFEDSIWFKIYSDKELDNGMRKLYGAKWINYENQLLESDIIYDEQHINGLWAMPYEVFFDCFNEECKENYGDKFFILKTVPDCHYLFDKKELIGDRFKVVAKSTLELSNGYMNIIKLYNELQKKFDSEISSFNSEITELKNEYNKRENWIKQLKSCNTKLIWLSRILLLIIVGLLFYFYIRETI